MTPEQFNKAQPIVNVLQKVNRAIEQALKACRKIQSQSPEDIERDKDVNSGMTGGYCCRLSEHKDGSGDYAIQMDDCWVGDAMAYACLDILRKKKLELETLLAEI